MDVGFTGSRNYPLRHLVDDFVRKLAQKYPDVRVISGGRGNVDETAEKAGLELGLEVISYRPKEDGIDVVRFAPVTGEESHSKVLGWKTFVQNCFFRNEYIAGADQVVAFWDGHSRGTADTISKARGKGRPVFVYDVDGRGPHTPEEVARQLGEVLG